MKSLEAREAEAMRASVQPVPQRSTWRD
jgi:hypothetical protein